MYIILPEGFYTDGEDSIKNNYSGNYYGDYNDLWAKGIIKKQDGSTFNVQFDYHDEDDNYIDVEDSDEYLDYVKNHTTVQVVSNWKNTNKTLIKIVVDYSDAPLDFKNFHYYNEYFPSGGTNFNLPESHYFNIYFDRENIVEYNTNTFEIQTYIRSLSAPTSIPSNSTYTFVRDTQDLNGNNKTTEYMYNENRTINVQFSTESNQDLMSFVKSEDDQYNSEYTVVNANDTYSYKLRARNASSKITNLVIYDSLENNIKVNGEFVKAAGDNTNTFKGTFQGVDTSYAQSQGYKVKVYYSESDNPGSLGGDSSWNLYTEGTTDKTKVKSLAFEYYKSNGTTKATLPADSLTYVVVNMKAPDNIDDNKVTTYKIPLAIKDDCKN